MTTKILISLPNQLVNRMRTTIPARKRSLIIMRLIEKEVKIREEALYECALAVENDLNLKKEMADWDTTLDDGLNKDESW